MFNPVLSMILLLFTKCHPAASDGMAPIKLPNRMLNLAADITLGGIFSLQEAKSSRKNGLNYMSCDEDHINDDVFLTEAMVYAIEQINSDPEILPNITLGYTIQGTCDNSVQNMLFSLDFYLETATFAQSCDPQLPETNCSALDTSNIRPMAAIIGPPSSSGSASVASLFRLQSMPVISYAAADPELSAKRRFPTFFRTIYSNDRQAAALADLVDLLDWTYLAVVGSDDSLGRQGVYQFKRAIWQKGNICISLEKYLSDTTNATSIVTSLRTTTRADSDAVINVTLLFMDWNSVYAILKEAQRQSLTHMTWLGVDQWTANMNMTSETQEDSNVGVMPGSWSHGAIATQFPTDRPYKFAVYMSKKDTIEGRLRFNPWLLKYFCDSCKSLLGWNTTYGCLPEDASSDECLTALSFHNIIIAQHRVVNVIQAVYAVAHALHAINMKNHIERRNGQLRFNYTELVEELYQVDFSRDDLTVKFNKNGDLDNATILVHHYFLGENSNGSCPAKDIVAGRWNENGDTIADRIQMNLSQIRWRGGSKPISVCHQRCQPGSKVAYGPSKCCWSCEPCPTHEFSNETHSDKCHRCPDHSHTNPEKTECVANGEVWICSQDVLGITSIVFAGIGMLATVISAGVTVLNRNHQSFSGKTSLKTITLLSCLFGYFNVVFWVVQPTSNNCQIRRIGLLLISMAHCLRAFFISPIGLIVANRTASWLHIPSKCAQEFSFFLHLLFAGFLHYGLSYPFPYDVVRLDLPNEISQVNGETTTSFIDCQFDTVRNTAIIMSLSGLQPSAYWLSAVISCYRGREKIPKRQRISSAAGVPTMTVDDNRILLFVSYFVLLVILATMPVYLASHDPYLHSFILLVIVFVCNSLFLLFFIAPRVYKIYFKRELAAIDHLFLVDTSISANTQSSSK